MGNGYVIPLDPVEMATRFPDPKGEEDFCSLEEALDYEEYDRCSDDEDSIRIARCAYIFENFESSGDFDISVEDMQSYYKSVGSIKELIEPLLDRIPDREADLIDMYFLAEKKQVDIATVFGVTQAAISYRLDRGIKRIKFLLSVPQVSSEEMQQDLSDVFSSEIDVAILVGMWETTCQSEVALRLNLTQGRVRHRFFRSVRQLKDIASKDSKYSVYYQIFSTISGKNFNILREVRLPQWSDRGNDHCF